MTAVTVSTDNRFARISGGARASDVLAVTDPLGLAPVTGSYSGVGMAGLTLGGGYGPLIGRFGLALDNLCEAQVVLADGHVAVANHDDGEELLWALRGGGGNFGVVTAMQHRLHKLPSVRSGMLIYPFSDARAVLSRVTDIAASMPIELTVQVGVAAGPDGAPAVLVVPTWSGPPADGAAHLAPFFQAGMVIASSVDVTPYGGSLKAFDAFIVNGRRAIIETCWLPALDNGSIDAFIQAMETAVSPGCAILTHEFKGAASCVPAEDTAFGLRRDHLLVEILASFVDRSDPLDEQLNRRWAQTTLRTLGAMALPGGYPNLLANGDADRVAKSYGPNVERLIRVKRRFDPDNIFCSAIPLPVPTHNGAA
jgi:hypothetical protein